MIRETCICEQPTTSAISDCSRSSEKRRRRISRARSSRMPVRRSSVTPASTRSNSSSWTPIRSPADAESFSSSCTGASSERTERPSVACSASTISSALALEPRGEVGDGRLAAELAPQRLARLLERQAELLQVARRAHVPGRVAEVAAQLAEDRRHGVGREREPALGVPAVDGLDEADGRDLDQVVERLARAPVAQRERAGERHVALDQLLARALVAGLDVPHEALIFALPPRAIDRGGRRGARPLGRRNLSHQGNSVPLGPRNQPSRIGFRLFADSRVSSRVRARRSRRRATGRTRPGCGSR